MQCHRQDQKVSDTISGKLLPAVSAAASRWHRLIDFLLVFYRSGGTVVEL